jgi:protein-tyrosine phosphatase
MIAYLMKKLNLSVEDATEFVKELRPEIEPNPGI